ncbi:hypothetical protein ACFQE1_03525 [Halobium palmae]|uniref:Uncharacterized protein n=1 Tax=Halobium palmae TaxID=1776492 RepID=A0ABD5RVP1_9EURY
MGDESDKKGSNDNRSEKIRANEKSRVLETSDTDPRKKGEEEDSDE